MWSTVFETQHKHNSSRKTSKSIRLAKRCKSATSCVRAGASAVDTNVYLQAKQSLQESTCKAPPADHCHRQLDIGLQHKLETSQPVALHNCLPAVIVVAAKASSPLRCRECDAAATKGDVTHVPACTAQFAGHCHRQLDMRLQLELEHAQPLRCTTACMKACLLS